jgi:hypothetical protein
VDQCRRLQRVVPSVAEEDMTRDAQTLIVNLREYFVPWCGRFRGHRGRLRGSDLVDAFTSEGRSGNRITSIRDRTGADNKGR